MNEMAKVIVEQLQERARFEIAAWPTIKIESVLEWQAADAIEALQAEVERLTERRYQMGKPAMTDLTELVARKIKMDQMRRNPMHDEVSRKLNAQPTYEEKEVAKAYISAILAALRDAGYAVVPVEPTEEMCEAWAKLAIERIKKRAFEGDEGPGAIEGARQSYKAMLAAVPEADNG